MNPRRSFVTYLLIALLACDVFLRLTGCSISRAASSAMDTVAPRQQCEAITRKGNGCSRKAERGSHFCWQHNR